MPGMPYILDEIGENIIYDLADLGSINKENHFEICQIMRMAFSQLIYIENCLSSSEIFLKKDPAFLAREEAILREADSEWAEERGIHLLKAIHEMPGGDIYYYIINKISPLLIDPWNGEDG